MFLQKVPIPVKKRDMTLLNSLVTLDSGFHRNDEFQGLRLSAETSWKENLFSILGGFALGHKISLRERQNDHFNPGVLEIRRQGCAQLAVFNGLDCSDGLHVSTP